MRQKNVRLEQSHDNLVTEMADDGVADSESGVVRDAITHYGQVHGYVNGQRKDTPLRALCREAGKVAGVVGLVSLVFFAATPIDVGRYLGLLGLLMATGLFFADRALASVEPAISKRLKGVVAR